MTDRPSAPKAPASAKAEALRVGAPGLSPVTHEHPTADRTRACDLKPND